MLSHSKDEFCTGTKISEGLVSELSPLFPIGPPGKAPVGIGYLV